MSRVVVASEDPAAGLEPPEEPLKLVVPGVALTNESRQCSRPRACGPVYQGGAAFGMDYDRRAVQAHRFEAQRQDPILLLSAKLIPGEFRSQKCALLQLLRPNSSAGTSLIPASPAMAATP
jgi:hypothetical protein